MVPFVPLCVIGAMKQHRAVHIWAALPTPLTQDLKVDLPSLRRMIRDAWAGGITGMFLAGTCGEGPWLPDRERRRLVDHATREVARIPGEMKIAVQVSDNSVPRILDNIRVAADCGANYAIIAPPAVMMNATPERIAGMFTEAIAASSLPIGIYDLGRHRPTQIPEERLREIYLLHNVHLVKDSSGSPARRAVALAAREQKPTLLLFNGDEFACLEYLQAGYDGVMFGGAVAVAPQLKQIVALHGQGRHDEALAIEKEMKHILFGIYGGEKILCWLTGLKYYMVRRGLFTTTASFLEYPLTDDCRAFVEGHAVSGGNPMKLNGAAEEDRESRIPASLDRARRAELAP